MPAASVLQHVFADKLVTSSAERSGVLEVIDGVDCERVHAVHAVFHQSADGVRRYVVYQKPKSRPLLGSILGAGIRMATDFRNNNLDLGAHKIPDNQKGIQGDHANPKLLTEEYWSPHEERYIENILQQPILGAASDVSLPRLRNVIYARLGFKDGCLVAIYDGKSGRAAPRTAKHKATQAQWGRARHGPVPLPADGSQRAGRGVSVP